MADEARQTVKIGGRYYRPGETLPVIKDAKLRAGLIASGVIEPEAEPVAHAEGIATASESKKGGRGKAKKAAEPAPESDSEAETDDAAEEAESE